MGTEVHYREPAARYTACDVPVGEPGHLNYSAHRLAITCEDCLKTPSFKRSVQIIPPVQGGPYRG